MFVIGGQTVKFMLLENLVQYGISMQLVGHLLMQAMESVGQMITQLATLARHLMDLSQ